MLNTLDLKYDNKAYLLAKKLSGEKQEEFILSYVDKKKTFLMTFLMWWVLGIFGGHRFFLGDVAGGVRFILSWILIILPFILYIIDFIGLAKKLKKHNSEIAINCYDDFA